MTKIVCCNYKASIRINAVSYRIALGPQQGQKVFTLQTLPASSDGEYGQLANTSGFSLHAATSCREISANADAPDVLAILTKRISGFVLLVSTVNESATFGRSL